MLQVIIKVETMDEFKALVAATKRFGLSLDVGIAEDEAPQRRPRARKAPSTRRKVRRQRYNANLQIKVGPEPEGPPTLIKLHRKIVKKYGKDAFRKGDLKQAVLNGSDSTTPITRMLESGALIPAS
jgi:hypothetical protein